MSADESKAFTTRELLREIINEQKAQGNDIATIKANMITGKATMEENSKDIKSLSAWMNGIKAGISLIGGTVGIHFFKNGGL